MAYTTIDNPELYFQTKLYTGTGSSQAHTFDGSENMQPDFLWFKRRASGAAAHGLFNVITGVTKLLKSADSDAEVTVSSELSSFDTDGFTLGSGGDGYTNQNSGKTYVAWGWKGSGSTASNSDGSVTSTISVNTTAGFSVGTFTKTGNNTIGHGLGSTPALIIARAKNQASDWRVWVSAFGANQYINLNSDGAISTSSTIWQNTLPTSTVFSMGSLFDNVLSIFFAFSEKQGHLKVGRYVGNGNADGTFVYTGFKPAFVLIKCDSNSGHNWQIRDNKRPGYNTTTGLLKPNSSAEEQNTDNIDLLSNGFKQRNSAGDDNASGQTYIYMAIAEKPFVNSNSVPNNAD